VNTVIKFLVGVPLTLGALSIGVWLLSRRSPRVMTYEEALRFFVMDRPRDNAATKGVMYRKTLLGNIEITRAFLDAQNRVLLSKKDLVDKLDQELLEAFGDGDLIVVE